MSVLRTAIATSLIMLPASGAAQEQPDTFRLRELVVTATRLPTRIGHAPAAVTVLTGAELRARGVRYVTEALRTVPGVAVAQSGGPGALTSVFIRGGEADYVQVLVDGVQVNDPGGSFNWAHLRTDDIERIEIVRGPVSVLYGSDAVSGVVQIFTRAGGAPRLEVGATGGRGDKPAAPSGTYRNDAVDTQLTGSLSPALALGTIAYGASYARHASNGLYAFNSDYDNTNASAKLGLTAARADIAFTVRRTDSEFQYPTNGAGEVVDRNQLATTRATSAGGDAGVRLSDALELRLLLTLFDGMARTDNPADDAAQGAFWSTSDVRREAVDARINVRAIGDAVLTAGFEHERQDGQTAFESVSEFGTFTDATDERRRNNGAYLQLHGTLLPHVALTVGGRIDDNDAFGTFRTGRAAVSWLPGEGSARVHAALGTAFKEPTFFENFAAGFARGNPELEPESSRSWEIGAEQSWLAGRLTAGVTWFDQRFRNLIQYTSTPVAADGPNYYNIAAATARGVELTMASTWQRLALNGSYTYTRTRVTEAGFGGDRAFADGEPLVRRPEHQAGVSATFAASAALRVLLDVVHTGERADLDFTNPLEWQGLRTQLPAWTTADLGVEYAVLRRAGMSVDISLRARNLFDARHDEIYNFPAPGRVLQLGVRAGAGL